MTINVEYNQLDPLLRETVAPEGDVNDPETGFSPYPGNINQLLFRLEPYTKNLERTSGVMGEFVNPKYADAEKTKFKKPTRLECMMQDYPKMLPPGSKVGFTTAEAWCAYSACKNNVAEAVTLVAAGVPAGSASQAEADQYFYASEMLRLLGAKVTQAPAIPYLGIPVSLGPKIVFDPSFALFPSEIKGTFIFMTKPLVYFCLVLYSIPHFSYNSYLSILCCSEISVSSAGRSDSQLVSAHRWKRCGYRKPATRWCSQSNSKAK